MMNMKKFLPLLVITTGFMGCSKIHLDSNSGPLNDSGQIFGNRASEDPVFFAMLKLKNPALLAQAQREGGKTKIDMELAEKIQKEQEETILKLQQLATESKGTLKVIYRYRLVLNAITIVAPTSMMEKVRGLPNVTMVEKTASFGRPQVSAEETRELQNGFGATSVGFIGAEAVHKKGIRGQGMKVGILDTGIDYTHAMLGGVGTEEAYKSVDPATPNAMFPNKKVVGGIDLVGTEFDSASADIEKRIPKPDANPLDEGGHGSHVAGTVAGIGDGTNTYSGVAPDAALYAVKVFGKDGSTSDEVVIQGLEYSADPNADLNLDDQLDVINMSLGSPYGSAHVMYSEAIKNLVRGGTVVVASAGNSGNQSYIVGSPSVSDEAISVAASIDNMDHNYKFRAVKFASAQHPEIITEAVEGVVSKPIEQAGDVKGKLVFVGTAVDDLTPEMAAAVKGNVALIDRGVVAFSEKIKRAQAAGAIGVIVANNRDEAPFAMGGEGSFQIPSIMISKVLGDTLKADMKLGDVVINFMTDVKIEKPELIDTLTGFTSRGPRSSDGFIKPEISAPGESIVSAKMAGGAKGVRMSGTSMAGPHMAGVMALIKQAHPDLEPLELKSVAMGSTKTLVDAKKEEYPVSYQGAGRILVEAAVGATLVADQSAISLGEVSLEKKKVIKRTVVLKNISDQPVSGDIVFKVTGKAEASAIQVKVMQPTLSLAAGETQKVELQITLDASLIKTQTDELDGVLKVMKGEKELHRIPLLAVAHKLSAVKAKDLKVQATSQTDGLDAVASVVVENKGANSGDVLLFNLLGTDSRKEDKSHDSVHNLECDLQVAGYRIVDNGEGHLALQVAAKLYNPLTTWNTCELNVQLDSNGDQVADQEIAGVPQERLPGITGTHFVSMLLDSSLLREKRKAFEAEIHSGNHKAKEDYTAAVQDTSDMTIYDQSTIAIVEADLSLLVRRATGELAIKVSTTHVDSGIIEMDDYLGKQNKEWKKISTDVNGQAFKGIPATVSLAAGESKTLELTKGQGLESLLVLMPQNQSSRILLGEDQQSLILKPSFVNQ